MNINRLKSMIRILPGLLALVVFVFLFFAANLWIFSARASKVSAGQSIGKYSEDRAAVITDSVISYSDEMLGKMMDAFGTNGCSLVSSEAFIAARPVSD